MTDTLDRLKAVLSDRYAIEREIGSGGMATVYLAEDLKHHRQVAIKVLRPDLAATLGPERFLREIEVAAQLQHPHILPLHDSGEADGFLYYVMPFVEGQSLRDKLNKEGELPVGEAVRILRDVVDALTEAHVHGVVHRDIKPENILLRGRHALVTDFGVAKAVSEATGRAQLTTAGVALGTPAYMAPEQAAADPHLDQRVDIYAVGAVAYELLTGRPVFMGTTPQMILSQHVTETPDPVTQHRATVPAPLAALVMRCLEKKPADRWQSAEELMTQLEGLLTPSGGVTPTDTRPIASAAPRRRRVGIGIAAAAAVVALGAVGVWIARPRSSVIASASRIAVLPFAPAVPDTALSRLGRELMVLLSANLDGVGSMTTVDASALLVKIGSGSAPIGVEDGASLGHSFGAASIVSGNLVRTGDDVRVEATLTGVDHLETVARASVVAPVGDVGALADSLTWAILAQVWHGREAPTPSLTAHMTKSFEALRAFLDGEQAFLEGRYPDAAAAYTRAIHADSTFWLAYWRLRKANGWLGRDTPEPIVEAYWEHRADLPERDRMLIEAERAPTRSEMSAMRLAATRRYPDYSPAWWDYADRLAHLGGFFGHPLEDAYVGLDKLTELSPASASAWDHVAFIAQKLGDSAGSARGLEALDRLGARKALREGYGFDIVGWLEVAHRVLFDAAPITPALVDSAAAIIDGADPTASVIGRAVGLLAGDISPELQGEAARALLRRGVSKERASWLRWDLALNWMIRGAWDSGFAALDRHLAADVRDGARLDAYRLAVIGAWLGAIDSTAAAERRGAASRDATAPADRAELAWLDGVLGFVQHDAAAVSAAGERVRDIEAPSANALQRSLAALGLDLAGDRRGATERMLALVQATGDSGMQYRYAAFDAVARLTVSRWLLDAGDAERALPPLYWVEAWYTGMPAVEVALVVEAPVLLQRAHVEEALGRRADAARHYREVLRLYDKPTGRQRELVSEAQQALARLGDSG